MLYNTYYAYNMTAHLHTPIRVQTCTSLQRSTNTNVQHIHTPPLLWSIYRHIVTTHSNVCSMESVPLINTQSDMCTQEQTNDSHSHNKRIRLLTMQLSPSRSPRLLTPAEPECGAVVVHNALHGGIFGICWGLVNIPYNMNRYKGQRPVWQVSVCLFVSSVYLSVRVSFTSYLSDFLSYVSHISYRGRLENSE